MPREISLEKIKENMANGGYSFARKDISLLLKIIEEREETLNYDPHPAELIHEIRMKHPEIFRAICKELGDGDGVEGQHKLRRIIDGEEYS